MYLLDIEKRSGLKRIQVAKIVEWCCVTKFIEERAKLVRSLADKADPFIKRRLVMLADKYESQLATPSKATRALNEIQAVTTFLAEGER